MKNKKNVTAQELCKKYKSNNLFNCLVDINYYLGLKFNNETKNLDLIEDYFSSFNAIIDSKSILNVDSLGCLNLGSEPIEDFYTHDSLIFVCCLIYLACFKVNLESLESQNSKLKGLNNFLLKEFPSTYNAYCEMSDQFEFKTIVQISDEPSPLGGDAPLNSNNKSVEKDRYELLEFDGNAKEEKVIKATSIDGLILNSTLIPQSPKGENNSFPRTNGDIIKDIFQN